MFDDTLCRAKYDLTNGHARIRKLAERQAEINANKSRFNPFKGYTTLEGVLETYAYKNARIDLDTAITLRNILLFFLILVPVYSFLLIGFYLVIGFGQGFTLFIIALIVWAALLFTYLFVIKQVRDGVWS